MSTELARLPLPAEVVEDARTKMADAIMFADIATDFKIETAEDARLAGTQLQAMAGFIKDTDNRRLSFTRPYDALKKDIMAEYGPSLAKAGEASNLLRRALTDWTQEQERAAAEARRKEQERIDAECREAERVLKVEEDRLASLRTPEARAKAEDRVAAASSRVDEAMVSAPIVAAAPKVSGFGLRDNWQPAYTESSLRLLICEIAGVEKIARPDLLKYVALETMLIGKMVKALKEDHGIPGVSATNNKISAVRGG